MISEKTILSILAKGESSKIEFKKNFSKEAIVSVNAFANTKGGKILLGVNDSGEILGLDIPKETIQKWINEIKVKTSPSIIVDIYNIKIKDKIIAIIIVDEFPIKPVALLGRFYKRVKNSNHLMDVNEIANLYMKVLNPSWDSLIYPGYNKSDLNGKKIQRFISEVEKVERFNLSDGDVDLVTKLKLIKDNKPTAASLLLFAEKPLLYNIHIGRFRTPSLIIDDKQVCNTLFEATEETMKFIKNYIKVAFEFDGSTKRKEIFEYPIVALREAVLNAIVHRDYSVPGDIQIKIFDDKITIFNPGKLLNLTVEDLQKDDYHSQLRNLLVAEAFYLTKNIEKYGSGLIRIRKELEKYKNISFHIEEKTGGVLVVFEKTTPKTTLKTTPKTTPKSLAKIENQIIELVIENNRITKTVIGDKLGLSEDGVKYHIRKMTEKKILEWKGTSRKGYWEIKEDLSENL